MTSIFVSIANYRDPELGHTVETLVRNLGEATHLRICILSQCREEERIVLPNSDRQGRVKIEQQFIDAVQSRGVGWARAEIQRSFGDEEFYLQIDSHVQLVPDWDRLLMADYLICAAKQEAILTTYLCEYRCSGGKRYLPYSGPTHFKVEQKRWLPTARAVVGYPHIRPVRAPFFSGHFAFAPQSFVKKVPYDPEIFFMGEEISMAIRAYSAGYDLFTPTQFMGSHLYQRTGSHGEPRPMFWNDADDAQRAMGWARRDAASKAKVGAICRGELRGLYGVRDAARYEAFKSHLLQRHNVDLSRAIPDGTEQRT